jgi:hypothetical protein
VSTAFEIACPLLVCGGFVYGFIRHLIVGPDEQLVDETDARMATAIAAENHPGCRAAITIARHTDMENL